MEKCKECGRGFRSRRALGGHMSTAHARRDGVAGEAEVEKVPATVAVPGEPEEDVEPDKAESIRELLRRGYSARQIKEEFGYARSTVDQVALDFVKPENPPPGDRADDGLPAVRKAGQGVEVIPPETILRRYMDGEGDERELRGMMKLRAAMLMVGDLINMRKAEAEAFALEVKPILELMKETRAEQDAAAERARASSLEAAREAAQEALGQALPYIDDRLRGVEEAAKQRAEAPHPFPEMMKVLDGTLASVAGQMMQGLGFGGQGVEPEVPGFTRKKRGQEVGP